MSALGKRGAAFTDLVLEVFRLNRLLLDAGDVLTAPSGLSSARWQVLGVVEHGPVTVANVARVMGLTRQSVQQTADGLVEEGFIVFSENPQHQRAKLMALTTKGRRALDAVLKRHARWANEIGEGHTLAALEQTLAELQKLRASLEARRAGAPK
jgi:DNA-binding MarR family transcriptional regulator